MHNFSVSRGGSDIACSVKSATLKFIFDDDNNLSGVTIVSSVSYEDALGQENSKMWRETYKKIKAIGIAQKILDVISTGVASEYGD